MQASFERASSSNVVHVKPNSPELSARKINRVYLLGSIWKGVADAFPCYKLEAKAPTIGAVLDGQSMFVMC